MSEILIDRLREMPSPSAYDDQFTFSVSPRQYVHMYALNTKKLIWPALVNFMCVNSVKT